jgi:DNA-binding transcriptional ArsR family regulator
LLINHYMRRGIFHAIADPTRRAILVFIAAQAMTPNALAEHFDTTRQPVSKHLRILAECELINMEYRGREIYYQLEIRKMKEIDKWWSSSGRFGKAALANWTNLWPRSKNKKYEIQFAF